MYNVTTFEIRGLENTEKADKMIIVSTKYTSYFQYFLITLYTVMRIT